LRCRLLDSRGRRSHGTLEAELYTPVGRDPQQPHDRDEIYVVARGEGIFFDGAQRHTVGAGGAAQAMSGRLEAAVRRGVARRGRFSRVPLSAGAISVVVYAALFAVSAVSLLVTWVYPTDAGHVFEGIAALGVTLMAINALFCALLVAEAVECVTDPVGRSPRRLWVLASALVLVALVHWGAMSIHQAAHFG